MRYFCEGAGPAPGYRTGQREKQTPPTSLRLGDHLAGAGGGGRGDSRNEEVAIEKWFVWVTWLAGSGWLQTQETLCSEFQTEIN